MNITILDFQKNQSLGLVLFQTETSNTFDYVSCSYAIENNFVEVTEISEGGSVNNLLVINHSDKFVFFMDGDILQGAKQNRVINTSMLLAPNSKTSVPVSCVEAGRWRYASSKFHSSDYIAPGKLRSDKAHHVKLNLMINEDYCSDQSNVWDKISEYQDAHLLYSKTSNLSDVYDGKRKDFDKFISGFKTSAGANGVVIFVKKNILNLDVFNRTDIFDEYFPKMLRAAAMEAYHIKDSLKPLSEVEAKYRINDFFDNFEKLEFSTHKSLGAGEERRFETKEFTGLELDYENHLIHLTALGL